MPPGATLGAGLGPGQVARAEALRPPAGLPVMGLYQASGRGGLWGGVCILAGLGERVLNRYCTCLFFINELLEVPGELQSLRGWVGLPGAPSWTKDGTARAAHGGLPGSLHLLLPGAQCTAPMKHPLAMFSSWDWAHGHPTLLSSGWGCPPNGGSGHAQESSRHWGKRLEICSLATG